MVIVCNPSDSKLPTYQKLLNVFGEILVVPDGRRGMCDSLNQAFQVLESKLGFAVAFMGDDHRPRTIGWDFDYLWALYGMKAGLVYGNDLFQGERIPTQVAMTTNIPRTLGYMVPPEFQHLFVDNVWKDWGDRCGIIRYLPEVVVEHLHPIAGKARTDSGYEAVNSGPVVRADQEAYAAYCSSGRLDEDLSRIGGLL